jgi:hypothetical protein
MVWGLLIHSLPQGGTPGHIEQGLCLTLLIGIWILERRGALQNKAMDAK